VKYPVPKNKKEVKQFTALCNFYRRFVKDLWSRLKIKKGPC